MAKKLKETKEEKKARELRELFQGVYENYDEESIKNRIVELLDRIDDLEEQKKAYNDSMKDQIEERKDELLYCRQRRHYLRSAQYRASLEEQADEIIEKAEALEDE